MKFKKKITESAAGLPTGHKGYNFIGTWKLNFEDI